MRAQLIALFALAWPVIAAADPTPPNQAQAVAPPAPQALRAGHYKLDPKHASLTATVRHLRVSNYVMRFDKLNAEFSYDPAHPQAAVLTATVEPGSLDVGASYSRQFADDFLGAAKFPTASFTATAMKPDPDLRGGAMTGDLTLMGVTRPVTFQVRLVGVGHGVPFGVIAGLSATAEIERSEFGSKGFLNYVGDTVVLHFEGEFDRQ
ncbi:MAG TPA: YceI family protein [Caulobacteraceae bacterium]|jgi:polyisoprenoid-binding protein YceI